MIHLLHACADRSVESDAWEDCERWIMASAYFCFCFILSLRSTEGLMTDLQGLLTYCRASNSFVIVPLKGQVKGESHTRHHLLHNVNVTDSGIDVCSWVWRLIAVHLIRGRSEGPAFVDPTSGNQSSSMDMNDLFLEVLVDLHNLHFAPAAIWCGRVHGG
jgi:hypothetical protein